MSRAARTLGLALALILVAGLLPLTAWSQTVTTVTQGSARVSTFSGESFNFEQCYARTEPLGATFGQDVCVRYEGISAERVVTAGQNVVWSLVQLGTATLRTREGALLQTAPFRATELGQDLGGDARCVAPDGHAWTGQCTGLFTAVDSLSNEWEIAHLYTSQVEVAGPGRYCTTYDVKGWVSRSGTACAATPVTGVSPAAAAATPAPTASVTAKKEQAAQRARELAARREQLLSTRWFTTSVGLRLRDEPSINANVLDLVFPGTALRVTEGPIRTEQGDYYLVGLDDGSEGWVAPRFADLPPLIAAADQGGYRLYLAPSEAAPIRALVPHDGTVQVREMVVSDDGQSWAHVVADVPTLGRVDAYLAADMLPLLQIVGSDE